MYGYAGKLLRVDLTNEQITDEKLDEEMARKWIGGNGIGAKYLWEEVPAGVEWFDEDNRIIMAAGPLNGTSIGGSGTFSVVTRGPLTNGAGASQANGFFGAFLKFSGYDSIIVQGKAKKWVYLYVHDGKAELREASHLEGKNNYETCDLIQSELGKNERDISIASIGPAGEHLVRFAGILVDKKHAAMHNGTGAVMGSKKLKAVAVARGKTRTALWDREAVSALAKKYRDAIVNNPRGRGMYEYGTLNLVYHHSKARDGIMPVKNYTTSIFDIDPEKLEKYNGPYIRSHFGPPKPAPCWACYVQHCGMITLTEGPFKGNVGEEPEYEPMASFGPVIGVTDVTATIFLANEADRLGIDANESGWLFGLLMECYEKGILRQVDLDGLEMTWGNYDAVKQMMHQIAVRQGFGDILAEGVMRAAQRIGGEAPNFAIHTMKGNTPKTHDHRNRWAMMFDTVLAQGGNDEGHLIDDPESREELGLTTKPSAGPNWANPEETLAWNSQCKGGYTFLDCVGACRTIVGIRPKGLAQAVSAITGWDFSTKEAMEVGRRTVHLLRAFNIRAGHTPEMDAPSPRYGSAPVDGPSKGITIMTYWDDLRSRYYEQMGWDRETGKPLPETLRSFGLEYVIPELWGK